MKLACVVDILAAAFAVYIQVAVLWVDILVVLAVIVVDNSQVVAAVVATEPVASVWDNSLAAEVVHCCCRGSCMYSLHASAQCD